MDSIACAVMVEETVLPELFQDAVERRRLDVKLIHLCKRYETDQLMDAVAFAGWYGWGGFCGHFDCVGARRN